MSDCANAADRHTIRTAAMMAMVAMMDPTRRAFARAVWGEE
jgi:hypothetical protein